MPTPVSPASHLVQNATDLLKDKCQKLPVRFRALFTLKNAGGEDAVSSLASVLLQPDDCPLLKHEVAFCLGQMRAASADPILEQVLSDVSQHAMVRHEAAEALAAIASPASLAILQSYCNDPVKAVAQTCQLAVHSLMNPVNGSSGDKDSGKDTDVAKDRVSSTFGSVDPAFPATDTNDVMKLGQRLTNTSLHLSDRFSAMFALRNMRTEEATKMLAHSLPHCSDSPLIQHEIAYVLGQLQSPITVSSLEQVLKDMTCDEMVRHEAAEALGSIGTKDAMEILKQHASDPAYVVRSSIEIALDMADYENSDEQFNFL